MRSDGYIDPNALAEHSDAEGEFLHDLAIDDTRNADGAPLRAPERSWDESADAMDLFVEHYGHLPSRSSAPGSSEQRLALWIMNQRLLDNLDADRKARIARWDAFPKRR